MICACGTTFEPHPRTPHQRFCSRICTACKDWNRERNRDFRRRHPDYHRIWRANKVKGGVRPGARPCEGILHG